MLAVGYRDLTPFPSIAARARDYYDRQAKERQHEGQKAGGKARHGESSIPENLPESKRGDSRDQAVKAALLHPNGAKMSDEQVAEYVGVSRQTVIRYRHEMQGDGTCNNVTSRTGRDGRTIDTSNIGKKKHPNCGGTNFDSETVSALTSP